MRDKFWLENRMIQIKDMLFPDLELENQIIVRFKGRWKNKFGHIKLLRNKNTEIVVNGLFSNLEVPEYMIDITLAHELVHYLHGFQSPLKQKYKHPHKGGVVKKELIKRGFGHMVCKERVFIKEKWVKLYGRLNVL